MRIYIVIISWMRYPVILWIIGANAHIHTTGWHTRYWPTSSSGVMKEICAKMLVSQYFVFRIDSCWICQGSQLELAISVGSPPRIIQLMINLVSRYFAPGILFVILKSYILSKSVQNSHIVTIGKNKHWTYIYSFSNIQVKIEPTMINKTSVSIF
jgi:hypothetical protein